MHSALSKVVNTLMASAWEPYAAVQPVPLSPWQPVYQNLDDCPMRDTLFNPVDAFRHASMPPGFEAHTSKTS